MTIQNKAMESQILIPTIYVGGFMKVKELAARFNLPERTMRERIKDAGIELGCKHFISPLQINILIAEYGRFE